MNSFNPDHFIHVQTCCCYWLTAFVTLFGCEEMDGNLAIERALLI